MRRRGLEAGQLAKRAAKALLGRRILNRMKAVRLWLANGEQPSIRWIQPLPVSYAPGKNLRINLLFPSADPAHLFGGATTALEFFRELGTEFSRQRVIITDEAASRRGRSFLSEFSAAGVAGPTVARREVVFAAGRGAGTVAVSEGDIFVATTWWTAHLAQRIIEAQSERFGRRRNPLVYLIQDYEPAFYPWSSQYLLARGTYEYRGPTIAVFNTNLLREFIRQQGFSFAHEFSFEPVMNPAMAGLLPRGEQTLPPKRRRIVLYGRPSMPRNAFGLMVEALRVWARRHPSAAGWTVVSAGEDHLDVPIGSGLTLRSLGKLSLVEYARLLRESAVGLSWMVSPHPSYPPLEMAHFGLLTLTNRFARKDLSTWHENIVSSAENSPEAIGMQLAELCERVESDPRVGWDGKSHIPDYLAGRPPFGFIGEIAGLIRAGTGSPLPVGVENAEPGAGSPML